VTLWLNSYENLNNDSCHFSKNVLIRKKAEEVKMKKALPQIILHLLLIVFFTSIAHADFALQIGSFKYKQHARKYAKRLIEKNFNAFIHIQKEQTPGKGPWYKVRVGPFSTKDEAFKQREILQSNGFGDDIVVVRTSAEKAANPAAPSSNPVQARHNPHSEKATAPVQTRADTRSKKPKAPGNKNVTIKWDASEDPDLAGYKIYYDTDSGPPYDPDKADYADEGPSPIIVGPDVTEITLHGLTGTKDYFFTITAFNARRDLESDYSNEVAALSKPLPK